MKRLVVLPAGTRLDVCLTALRRFTALLLGLTALGKAVDLATGSVSGTDPVLQLDRRWVWTGAVLLELVVCGYLWAGRLRVVQGLLLLWLGGHFMAYHAALAGDRATGCGCLGWFGPTTESRPKTEERIAVGMATGMLVVGLVTLVAARATAEAESESGPEG